MYQKINNRIKNQSTNKAVKSTFTSDKLLRLSRCFVNSNEKIQEKA
jgi:hypothetical protein